MKSRQRPRFAKLSSGKHALQRQALANVGGLGVQNLGLAVVHDKIHGARIIIWHFGAASRHKRKLCLYAKISLKIDQGIDILVRFIQETIVLFCNTNQSKITARARHSQTNCSSTRTTTTLRCAHTARPGPGSRAYRATCPRPARG